MVKPCASYDVALIHCVVDCKRCDILRQEYRYYVRLCPTVLLIVCHLLSVCPPMRWLVFYVCIWLLGWDLGSPASTASATTDNRRLREREREGDARAQTPSGSIHTAVCPGRLSWFEKDSANTARTHIKRVRVRCSQPAKL